MTNEDFRARVEIMRDVGVMKFVDGDTEIVLFAPDQPAANDNGDDDQAARRKRDRQTFGGK